LSGLIDIDDHRNGMPEIFDKKELLDKLSGNMVIYEKLINKFLLDADQLILTISDLYEKKMWDEFRNEVHGLKGMAAIVCAKQMQYICKNIEKAVVTNDNEKLSTLLNQLRCQIEVFREEL